MRRKPVLSAFLQKYFTSSVWISSQFCVLLLSQVVDSSQSLSSKQAKKQERMKSVVVLVLLASVAIAFAEWDPEGPMGGCAGTFEGCPPEPIGGCGGTFEGCRRAVKRWINHQNAKRDAEVRDVKTD